MLPPPPRRGLPRRVGFCVGYRQIQGVHCAPEPRVRRPVFEKSKATRYNCIANAFRLHPSLKHHLLCGGGLVFLARARESDRQPAGHVCAKPSDPSASRVPDTSRNVSITSASGLLGMKVAKDAPRGAERILASPDDRARRNAARARAFTNGPRRPLGALESAKAIFATREFPATRLQLQRKRALCAFRPKRVLRIPDPDTLKAATLTPPTSHFHSLFGASSTPDFFASDSF